MFKKYLIFFLFIGCELFYKKEGKVILLSPSNLEHINNEIVKFEWQTENLKDIEYFKIYLGKNSENLKPLDLIVKNTFFEYSGLERNVSYYWYIKAKLINGEILNSYVFEFKFNFNNTPSIPLSFKIDTLSQYYQFNWAKSIDIDQDKFEYYFNYIVDGVPKSLITSDTLIKLSLCENLGKQIKWSIQTKDILGASSFSDTSNLQTNNYIKFNFGGEGFFFGDKFSNIFYSYQNEILVSGTKSIRRGSYEDKDFYIVKFDECGKIIDEEIVDNKLYHEVLKGHLILKNGDNLLYGYSYDQYLKQYAFLVLLSKNLDLKWKNSFNISIFDFFADIKEDINGNLICIGKTYDKILKGNLWLTKLSPDGQILKYYSYGGLEDEEGHKLILVDDGFIILGHNDSKANSKKDVWLFKTDTFGNILWEKQFGTKLYNDAFSIVKKNNSFYFSGYLASSNQEDIITSSGEMFIANYDFNGNEIWFKTYPNKYLIIPTDLKIIEEEVILLCGFTSQTGKDNINYFLRIDKNGNKKSEFFQSEIGISQSYSIIQNPNNKTEFFSTGYSNVNKINSDYATLIKFIFPN